MSNGRIAQLDTEEVARCTDMMKTFALETSGLTVEEFTARCRKAALVQARQDFMLEARQRGFSLHTIRQTLGFSDHKNIIHGARKAAARQGGRPVRPSEKGLRTVAIPVDILEDLKPSAVSRDISVNELVRRLVAEIADDHLVDSILDDGMTS